MTCVLCTDSHTMSYKGCQPLKYFIGICLAVRLLYLLTPVMSVNSKCNGLKMVQIKSRTQHFIDNSPLSH